MSPATRTGDDALESEVRAMLARRAADVSPSPTSRRQFAAALDSRPSRRPGAAGRTVRPTARPARRLLVAAVLVLVVGSAALAVRGPGPGAGDDTTVAGAPDRPEAFPAPGDESWDPATAAPVWPVVGDAGLTHLADDPHAQAGDLATPEAAAAAYLAELASPLVLDVPGLAVADDGRTAEVPWSFTDGDPSEPGAPPLATGAVHLRDVAEAVAAPDARWVVVGASTDGVTLEDVRVEGDRLAFTVVVVPPADTSVSVRVSVDGSVAAIGGSPLPQGADPPDPSAGELLPLADGRGEVDVAVVPGASVDVLLRSVGGDFLSVTHMAIEVPAPDESATAAPREPDAGDPAPPAGDATAASGDRLPTPIEPLDGSGAQALYAGRGSAAEVAQAYLDDRVPEGPGELVVDDARTTLGTIPGGGASAVIPWGPAAPDGPAGVVGDDPPVAERYSGEIRLQTVEGGWAVVAATTDQIALRDVRRQGAAVTVTVDRFDDAAIDLLELAVFDLEGNPVGAPASAYLGSPGNWTVDLGSDIAPDAALTLRARHMGGAVFSLSEVRVPAPAAPAVMQR